MMAPHDTYQSIISYMGRTELVRQAMKDLHPIEPSQRLIKLPPGEWRDSQGVMWQHFFHGKGCRLTHPTTGEVIDWDLAEEGVVDKFFFIRWLMSLIHGENGALSEAQRDYVTKDVETAFDELVDTGFLICLNPQYRHIYKLSVSL